MLASQEDFSQVHPFADILTTGVRACLLHIPERFQHRELVDRDYIFASGISAGFVGGTFNLINSRIPFQSMFTNAGGPKMTIPGLVMFSLAGFTGQFVLNALDNWRTRYIFEHEQEWQKTENPEPQNPKNHGLTEWERRFEFLGKYSGMKKTDPAKRLAVLRNEIEELDKKLQRVDDEIAKLERQKSQLQEKDNH